MAWAHLPPSPNRDAGGAAEGAATPEAGPPMSAEVAQLRQEATRLAMAEQRAMDSSEVRAAIQEQDRRAEMTRRAEAKRCAQWEALLERWDNGDDSVPASLEARKLGQCGIPERVRGRAWPMLIGNNLRITRRHYAVLCEQAAQTVPLLKKRQRAEAVLAMHAQRQRRLAARKKREEAAAKAEFFETDPAGADHAVAGRAPTPPLETPSGSAAAKTLPAAEGTSEHPTPPTHDPAVSSASAAVSTAASAAGAPAGASATPLVEPDREPRAGQAAAVAAAPTSASALDPEEAEHERELEEARRVLASTPVFGSQLTVLVVDLDVPRTFPHLSYFKPGTDMGEALRRILTAFICYRPDRGYIQGMSFVAATVLLHVPDEAQAFAAFANLMLRPAIFEAFGDGADMGNIRFIARLRAFARVVAAKQPRIANRLHTLDIGPDMFVSAW